MLNTAPINTILNTISSIITALDLCGAGRVEGSGDRDGWRGARGGRQAARPSGNCETDVDRSVAFGASAGKKAPRPCRADAAPPVGRGGSGAVPCLTVLAGSAAPGLLLVPALLGAGALPAGAETTLASR